MWGGSLWSWIPLSVFSCATRPRSDGAQNKNQLSAQKSESLEWSGWKDSNLRPPGPKPGALANCATPRQWMLAWASKKPSEYTGRERGAQEENYSATPAGHRHMPHVFSRAQMGCRISWKVVTWWLSDWRGRVMHRSLVVVHETFMSESLLKKTPSLKFWWDTTAERGKHPLF